MLLNIRRLFSRRHPQSTDRRATLVGWKQPRCEQSSHRDDGMSTAVIQRQFDEVIASQYDRDPQSVISNTLDRAIEQLREAGCLQPGPRPLTALDVGMGTGLFYRKLCETCDHPLKPYGLDISQSMIDIARSQIPELVATVDDGADLDLHFNETEFDLVCTHFVTGYVPFARLAPRIWDKLRPGGCWTFVGATSAAFPELQRKANSRLIQMLFRGRKLDLSGLLTPGSQLDVERGFATAGFEVVCAETFEPQLQFADFDEFMDFAYHGGWLTPFIEELGLHKARPSLKAVLDAFAFPMQDHHSVVVAVARKPFG